MPKKKPKKGKPQVNKDLEGFEININEFGEIETNTPIEKLNKFLDSHVEDKKLKDRPEYKELWKEKHKKKKESEESEKSEKEEIFLEEEGEDADIDEDYNDIEDEEADEEEVD